MIRVVAAGRDVDALSTPSARASPYPDLDVPNARLNNAVDFPTGSWRKYGTPEKPAETNPE